VTFSTDTKRSETSHPGIFRFLLAGILFCLAFQVADAQEGTVPSADTLVKKTHSASKAAAFSAVLPGLGQAYNKKYWKIPIIYAGFGVFAYFINQNTKEYKKFKEAYLWKVSNDTVPIDNDYIYKYPTVDQLRSGKDYYLRNVELSWIFCSLWYILNILDASVDAHLMDFDISDDITLHVEPGMNNNYSLLGYQPVAGVTMTLKFR
jgi:hypothetical protein